MLLGCSREQPVCKQSLRTTQQYVEQLRSFMYEAGIGNLVVVVCVDCDWIGGPGNRPSFSYSYKIVYSFNPSFRTGDIIVRWVHFEGAIADFWKIAPTNKEIDPNLYFMGINYNTNTSPCYHSFYTEEIAMPTDAYEFAYRKYYIGDACQPFPITYGFNNFYVEDVTIETNKIFEAYFILQEQYRSQQNIIRNHKGKPIVWTSREEAEELRKRIEDQGKEALFASDGHIGIIKKGHSDSLFPFSDTGEIWIVK